MLRSSQVAANLPACRRARSFQYGREPPRAIKATLTAAKPALTARVPPCLPNRAACWRFTFLFGGVCCVARFFWFRLVRRPVCLRRFGLLRVCRLSRLVSFRLRPASVAFPRRPSLVARSWCRCARCGRSLASPLRGSAFRLALARLPSVLRLCPASRRCSRLVIVRAAVVRVPVVVAVLGLPFVPVCASSASLGAFFFRAFLYNSDRGLTCPAQGACR